MGQVVEKIKIAVGTSLGLGYLPVAPGTWGALPGIPIFVAVMLLAPEFLQTWLLVLAWLTVCALTVVLGPWSERYFETEDPSIYVIDEVAGFLTTVLFFRTPSILLTTVWAFVVTRIIDIAKPPPARQLERLHGGWGILLDDVCTSIYAVGLLYLGAYLAPQLFGM